jgi:hypothetical protein
VYGVSETYEIPSGGFVDARDRVLGGENNEDFGSHFAIFDCSFSLIQKIILE